MPAVRIILVSVIAVCALASWQSSAQQQGPNNLVYQIFVRSFADADNDAAGNGDLNGIVDRLDAHLNDGNPATETDLEVGILWLMPIFPSTTYHGYDVTDFRNVHPEYGTLADFQALAAQAHKRGVRIILDIPLNHTSKEHPWFREAIAQASSPRRRFFHIKPGPAPSVPAGQKQIWHDVRSPSGEQLQYLGVFDPHMPDLNFENPELRQELEAIARFWVALGADGFRLDAAKHLYGEQMEPSEDDTLKNNAWWRDFSRAVYDASPNAVLVGEVLGDRERLRRYAWGLDALLDEPFMNEVRAAVAGPTEGLVGRHKQFLEQARELNDLGGGSSEPTPPPFRSFAFVASHDRDPRLASDIEDFKARGMSYSVDEGYRMALYMLLSLASHPVLYAGDELMQRGRKSGNPLYDKTLREPFPWFASGQGAGQTRWFQPKHDAANDGVSQEEQGQPGRMLHLARALTNLRTRHPAFANGDIGAIASDSQEWMVFERVSGNERYLVLINRGMEGRDYRFHDAWFPQYRGARLIFWSDGRQATWKDTTSDNQNIHDSVFVPPVGLVLLRQR
jgi:alpha-amylase